MAIPEWTIGTLYIQPHGPDGNWSQPDGQYGQVFPAQPTGNADYLSILPFNARTGVYVFGCQHSGNYCTVYRDLNAEGGPVALLCCNQCSYIQRVIDPWDDAFIGSVSYLQNALLYA
jgi:hypothetical protein